MRWLIALATAVVFSLPATDPFPSGTTCNLGDGTCPTWTVSAGGSGSWIRNLSLAGANPSAGGASHDVVFWNVDSFTSDQKSSVTVNLGGGNAYVGPAVRADASGNSYGFLCGTGTIYKQTAGSPGTLQSGFSNCANNDVVRLEATGTSTTTLKLFINNVQNGSNVSDSSSPFTTGSAGMYGYGSSDQVLSWTGDNIGGGGGTFPGGIINTPIRCCARTVRFGR